MYTLPGTYMNIGILGNVLVNINRFFIYIGVLNRVVFSNIEL
jgi:hypothetical protein